MDAHPLPEEVILLIEGSDTTVGFDGRHKLPMYAMHEIPEVWLADVNARHIGAHDLPMAGGYSRVRVFGFGETIPLPGLPDVSINVANVIPE